jgi:hypothetical protein
MSRFCVCIGKAHELIREAWGTSHLGAALETVHQEIEDHAIILEDKARKLKATD